MHIPKIDDYLKILTRDEVKVFADINFDEYFKSTREKLYSKRCEEQILRKADELLYIILTKSDKLEKYAEMMQSDSSDNYVHRYNIEILTNSKLNTKHMIKNKLKELLREMKKFKVQSILVLEHKKRNAHKIFHPSTKLTASDSDIDSDI